MLQKFFHTECFRPFVKFVNQKLKFHVDKQLKSNVDESDGKESEYNRLN